MHVDLRMVAHSRHGNRPVERERGGEREREIERETENEGEGRGGREIEREK